MKTILQWASLCAASIALVLLPASAIAQTTPTIQGTSLADPAVPVLVAPAPAGSGFFVLNQDFSLLQHSTVDASQNEHCDTGPGIYSRTNPAARTLVTDLYNAYMSGPDGPGLNTAVDAVTPEVTCTPLTAFDYTGGLATQSVAANDPQHALYYLVSAFGGAQPDQLLVLSNLNNATVSSTSKFTELNEAALDTNGVYTSIVSDTRSDFGLTAITELKTATSPGTLFVYYPQNNTVYRILGPGGVPLPAVTSFIIPPQTDGGGSLLVLVNQDGLTASNFMSPPQDTTPFTIIDLGQLRPIFATNPKHNTITLPFVTQIHATTSFYAMLGAAYNPLDHRIYAVVAGGTSVANVVESIISYDTLNPSAPAETVVADVSNVPFSLGSYPQLALNAASGTMQILTSNPSMVYTVGITGTGNNAVALTGSSFPDSNFSPTFIAANPLQGETYIASSSGQVDILTRPATSQGGLTITLTGSDLGYTSQEYQLTPLALWPVYDSSLGTAKLTITVTPKGGTPVVLATGHVSDIGYPGSSFYTYMFPAAGQYTIVATADASANYPAVTSPPLNVFVGNTGVYPTAISLSVPATAPSSNGEAILNATVNLTGTTYAPLNAVYIQDQTGAEVGNVQLPKGVISNPITIPITINEGVQTLTATYAGDEQNQSSTSTPQVITVGTVAKVTPTFAVTLPGTAVTGASVTGNLKLTSTSTTTPTGTVTIYATLSGSSTSNQIATVPAAQAFASTGMSFSFTAPTAGTYSVFAGYGGDTNYSNAISSTTSLIITAVPTISTTLGLTAPASAVAGTSFSAVVSMQLASTSSNSPTGNITLTAQLNGGSTTTVASITPAQAVANSGYTAIVSLPTAGTYTLLATYAGDANFGSSTKSSTVTVTAAPVQITSVGIVVPAISSPGATFNTVIAFNVLGAFTTQPTGNVVLTATLAGGSTTTIGTVTPSQGMAPGGANISVTLPNAGVYTLNANYAGDSLYAASSNTATVTVSGFPTTVKVTVGAVQKIATAFNATIALSTSGTTSAPTGNVVVTTTLTNGIPVTVATLTAAQAFATGGAVVPITLPLLGNYTLTATYSGGGNFAASTGTATFSVGALPTTLTLTGPATAAAAVTVAYTPSLAGGTGTPLGTVTISSTVNGVAGPSVAEDAFLAFGPGNPLPLTFAAGGVYTLVATYSGDATNGPSTSSPLTVTVAASTGAPGFTFTRDTFTPIDISSTKDKPQVVAVTLTSVNGFATPVTVTTANSTDSTLPGKSDQDIVIIKVVDHATGLPMSSFIPTAAGVHVDLLVEYSDVSYSRNTPPFGGPATYWAGGLVFFALLGLRKRGRRLSLCVLAVLVIVGAASAVAGCADPETQTMVVTAGPQNTTTPSQKMNLTIQYNNAW